MCSLPGVGVSQQTEQFVVILQVKEKYSMACHPHGSEARATSPRLPRSLMNSCVGLQQKKEKKAKARSGSSASESDSQSDGDKDGKRGSHSSSDSDEDNLKQKVSATHVKPGREHPAKGSTRSPNPLGPSECHAGAAKLQWTA